MLLAALEQVELNTVLSEVWVPEMNKAPLSWLRADVPSVVGCYTLVR